MNSPPSIRARLLNVSKQYGLRVADYAESLYGRRYSRQGAVASHFSVIGGPEDGSVFCSQVIVYAYLECDVVLIPGKDPAPYCPLDVRSAER